MINGGGGRSASRFGFIEIILRLTRWGKKKNA
jgi:hypothetical protein